MRVDLGGEVDRCRGKGRGRVEAGRGGCKGGERMVREQSPLERDPRANATPPPPRRRRPPLCADTEEALRQNRKERGVTLDWEFGRVRVSRPGIGQWWRGLGAARHRNARRSFLARPDRTRAAITWSRSPQKSIPYLYPSTRTAQHLAHHHGRYMYKKRSLAVGVAADAAIAGHPIPASRP